MSPYCIWNLQTMLFFSFSFRVFAGPFIRLRNDFYVSPLLEFTWPKQIHIEKPNSDSTHTQKLSHTHTCIAKTSFVKMSLNELIVNIQTRIISQYVSHRQICSFLELDCVVSRQLQFICLYVLFMCVCVQWSIYCMLQTGSVSLFISV